MVICLVIWSSVLSSVRLLNSCMITKKIRKKDKERRDRTMKTIIKTEKLVDEALAGIRVVLLKALDEKRKIDIEMSRNEFEVPSSGPVQEYNSTGEIMIQIKTGLRNSTLGKK